MDTEKPKATPQLDAARFTLAEQERNVWIVTAEEGVTRKDIENPAFFAHVARKCSPYDEILVRHDDGTVFARLLVLQAERTWLRTKTLEWHDLTTKDVAETETAGLEHAQAMATEFRVQWKGPHKKWCAIRECDGAIVREGEATKADAMTWVNGYVKVIA